MKLTEGQFVAELERLAGGVGEPIVLLAPTEQHKTATVQGILQRHRCAFIPLSWCLGLEIEDLKRFVAGADVFSKQSDGSTVASQYGKLGISLQCANTNRISGWAEILHPLGDPANGVGARLFIHERCARLVERLPSLQHDPNWPETF